MRSPASYPNRFSRSAERGTPPPSLDVFVAHGRMAPNPLSSRPSRSLPTQTPLRPSRRLLDGAQGEKRAFLSELRGRSPRDILLRALRKAELYVRRAKRIFSRFIPALAPQKMLYGSLVGGIAFGMVSMAFMEHYFGPGVFARSPGSEQVAGVTTVVSSEAEVSEVSGLPPAYDSQADIFFEYFNETADAEYRENVRKMVAGYPIEEMLPYIFEQDRLTAAFLIGIAKKESNWGKRIPVLEEQDCFNYWGYRGVRRMMGSGGHTCFNSRKDAVETVAKRLSTLIDSKKMDTPEKMIIWKCGFSCAGHSRESVKKWIADVDIYFRQLNYE